MLSSALQSPSSWIVILLCLPVACLGAYVAYLVVPEVVRVVVPAVVENVAGGS